jgi:hypothetical protein
MKKEKSFSETKNHVPVCDARRRGRSSCTWRDAIHDLNPKVRKTVWGEFCASWQILEKND